jgi:hypothetical protein
LLFFLFLSSLFHLQFLVSAANIRCQNNLSSARRHQCNFFLHTRCTKLPTRIEQHRLHRFHTLTLLQQATTKNGVFYCQFCSCRHCGFAYKCDTCWDEDKEVNTFDVQCGSIPKTLKHEGHQHPFCLAQVSKNRKCKACSKDNERYVFVCTKCDFILGIGCTNLPLVARHKYDTHLLKLTYAVEDNCREYYCLICEEKRDPNHWFYYCKECDFPAYTECVLGNYPRITIGSTYKSEYHEHPLTFVQKNKYSYQFCRGCYEDFLDEVALECSECKFKVHPLDLITLIVCGCGANGEGRMLYVNAQFPAGDVARSFDSWIGCSGYEHCTKKKRIGSKRDRG